MFFHKRGESTHDAPPAAGDCVFPAYSLANFHLPAEQSLPCHENLTYAALQEGDLLRLRATLTVLSPRSTTIARSCPFALTFGQDIERLVDNAMVQRNKSVATTGGYDEIFFKK